MNFEDRIKKAIQRGERRRDARAEEARAEALNLDEIKRLHSQYRLQLSEHIEKCVEQLTGHFPGFKFETIFANLSVFASTTTILFFLIALVIKSSGFDANFK